MGNKPQPKPPCRIATFFAADAPIAAILRRGPARWVRLIQWNTDTDVIVPGQWLHARVYERGCDLSPDGMHFSYYASDHRPHRQFDTWAAISRLPQFTALALWHTWLPSTGGTFLDRRTFVVPPGELLKGSVPGGWRLVTGPAMLHDEQRRYVQRSHRQKGWRMFIQWRGRPLSIHVQECIADRARHAEQMHDWLKHDPEELINAPAPPWTTFPPLCLFDQADRLIYARRGMLWRIDWVHGAMQVKEIADLNDMEPQPVAPDANMPGWA